LATFGHAVSGLWHGVDDCPFGVTVQLQVPKLWFALSGIAIAVNCWDRPTPTLGDAGVTAVVMLTTVMSNVPDRLVSDCDVAVTVKAGLLGTVVGA